MKPAGQSCEYSRIKWLGFCTVVALASLWIFQNALTGTPVAFLPIPFFKSATEFNFFSSETNNGLGHTFKPQNTKQIKTLTNVCIVEKPNAKQIETENGVFATEKEIVVFNSSLNKKTDLKVASGNVHCNSWPIEYTTNDVPPDFDMKTYPAYFIIPSHPGNLYHWFHDSTVGLYGAMKLTNGLNSSEPNQVVQRLPITGSPGPKNRNRYADIIKAFSVRDDQNVYHAFPSGTCFPYAVFGQSPSSQAEVAEFVDKQLDKVYPPKCPPGIFIAIIQRQIRRILNAGDLLDALHKAGYNNSRIVIFENMSFKEQWEIIRCSHILVGVQGAGLQWCIFLRKNSGLLELAHDNWDFLFSKSYRNFHGLKIAQLRAQKTYPDWKFISNIYFSNKTMTDSMKKEALSARNRKKYYDLWGGAGFKWADSVYDPKQFMAKISSLLSVVDII